MVGASCGLLASMYPGLHKPALRRLGAVIAAAIVPLLPHILAAQTLPQIEKAKSAVMADGDLQLQLPSGTEPPDSWNFSLSSIPIPPMLIWAILIAGAIAVLFYILKDALPLWRRRREGAWHTSRAEGDAAQSASAGEAMQAADELARQGRYVEAMHVLLLKSLVDMRQRLGLHFAESLTSREILRKAALSEAGKAALRDIVARVEWTYFGEHEAEASDYEACRDRFDELTVALEGGQGA